MVSLRQKLTRENIALRGISRGFKGPVFFLFLCIFSLLKAEVRHLTPPKLGEGHIGKKIVCYRPMRHPFPNLSAEKMGSKTVIHNYGHGGCGWSIAPGCVEYSTFLMGDVSLDTPIAVVGAGCIGLMTADS